MASVSSAWFASGLTSMKRAIASRIARSGIPIRRPFGSPAGRPRSRPSSRTRPCSRRFRRRVPPPCRDRCASPACGTPRASCASSCPARHRPGYRMVVGHQEQQDRPAEPARLVELELGDRQALRVAFGVERGLAVFVADHAKIGGRLAHHPEARIDHVGVASGAAIFHHIGVEAEAMDRIDDFAAVRLQVGESTGDHDRAIELGLYFHRRSVTRSVGVGERRGKKRPRSRLGSVAREGCVTAVTRASGRQA